MRTPLDEALDLAIGVRGEQLPSVAARLVDLLRVLEIKPFTEHKQLYELALLRYAARPMTLRQVDTAGTRRELAISKLILASSQLPLVEWRKVTPNVLTAAIPLAPLELTQHLVIQTFEDQSALADSLASASPFMDDAIRSIARARLAELDDLHQRHATAIAIETRAAPGRFVEELGSSANWFPQLLWWETADTAARIAAISSWFHSDARAEEKILLTARLALQKVAQLGGEPADPLVQRRWDVLLGKKPAAAAVSLEIVRGVHERTTNNSGVVSLGFASFATPEQPIVIGGLAPSERYWLWLEIGETEIPGADGGGIRQLPRFEHDVEIDVVLFGYEGQIELEPENRRALLRLSNGHSHVVEPAGVLKDFGGSETRAFFPIHTPAREGKHSLRISLYHRGVLLQSHVLSAIVGETPRATPAFALTTDYSLTRNLEVSAFEPADLSVLINVDPATDTHGFRFFRGEEKVASDAFIDGAQLAKLIEVARGALRAAAWGSLEPWRGLALDPYRYVAPDPLRFKSDIILLARYGYRLWSEILQNFAAGAPAITEFRRSMRKSGVVQLSLKRGAAFVFPLSLVYDYPLDSSLSGLTVCAHAHGAIETSSDLATTPCFTGDCPHYDDPTVVCPGGFWGFRHELGLPTHLANRDATSQVGGEPTPAMTIAVSTDPQFVGRAAHLVELATLGATTKVLDERRICLQTLGQGGSHVDYFYCHGGITKAGTPFLEVGAPGSDMITADNLIGISWEDPRPLVFLNGCHTAATTPEQVFGLVNGFLSFANASGVVGTEITIFEPLARAFGESLLRRFVAGGETLGSAMRRSRLDLVGQWNPLGLAYIPFALPNLRLRSRTAQS